MFKGWSFGVRRIQTQLLIWTALILMLAVAVISEIRGQSNTRLLQNFLQDRAESEVRTVASALKLQEARAAALQIPVVDRRLREFVESDPTLHRMDIVQIRDEMTSVLCSSSDEAEERISSIPIGMTSAISVLSSGRMLVTTFRVAGSDIALVAYSSLS